MQFLSNGSQVDNRAGQTASTAAAPTRRLGLSIKLLLLTVGFVMLAEVLIFVPSIANFRVNWLTDRLKSAQIAALAAEAAPGGAIPAMLRDQLLMSAEVKTVAIKRNGQRMLVLSEAMPPVVDAHYDLRQASVMRKLADALMVLAAPSQRHIRVIGNPPGMKDGDFIEIVIPEKPLKAAMLNFGLNILGLSIIISMVTATLVYLALNWLLVRPIGRITENMVHFAENPEDASRIIVPSGRGDEIGTAESELARMQADLRGMLQQKSRLAALGLAVSKISHDLRNILANAQLISDRLGSIEDPAVQRVTPKLIASLDRAIRLCNDTLRYGRASEAPPVRSRVALAPLVSDVRESMEQLANAPIRWNIDIPGDLTVDADPDQLYRVLTNLVRNAVQVLETSDGPRAIDIAARRNGTSTLITVSDTGPGIPEKARANLFVPFQGSARKGGTGLGLAIVAELVSAHGGSIELVEGGPGTTFHIAIPDR